jgi:hypothetical protein
MLRCAAAAAADDTDQAMTTELPTQDPISISRTPQKVQAGEKTVRMTARVRAAVEAMVWQGLKRDEAATAAGMKDNSLYVALRKPDVRAFYLAECEVLRLSGRARRIHRLEAVVEQDDNKMATVNAALALERLGDADAARPTAVTAGVVIRIINQTTAAPPLADVGGFKPAPVAVMDAQRAPLTIDAQPVEPRQDAAGQRIDEQGYPLDERGNRVFTPKRDW